MPRPRLLDALARALEVPVTLVVAPAGYGKSVLISQWIEELNCPSAWLPLDDRDSDLRVFLGYLLAAIDMAVPNVCLATHELLAAPKLPGVETLAGYLINDLDAIDTRFPIVLDDYHQLGRHSAVHELMRCLLRHPPCATHLIVITRRDPPLPLARLRATEELVEIRLQELRFTEQEASDFMARTMDRGLGEAALDCLAQQVEGWAVGLRMASLAARHANDPDQLIENLPGNFKQTQDFLIEQVLAAQAPGVRAWLLRSSVVDRFCVEILDALGAPDDAPPELGALEFLDELQQRNLFVIPLDAHGKWFRYHHLFRDLLFSQLKRHHRASEIARLHMRASARFEQKEAIEEAIDQALTGGDPVRAAEILERHRSVEFACDRWHVVKRWLAKLPFGIKQERPGLLLTTAWVEYGRLQTGRIQSMVQKVERLLEGQTVDPTRAGELAFFQGSMSYWMEGDPEGSRQRLEGALSLLAGRGASYVESEAELALALARCMSAQTDQAIERLEDRIRGTDPSDVPAVSRLIGSVSFSHLLSGDLPKTVAATQRMQIVTRSTQHLNLDAWSSYLLASCHLHAYELDSALSEFTHAVERRYVLDSRAAVDALAGLALTQQLQQQSDDAVRTVELLDVFVRDLRAPEFLSLAESCRARLAVLQGDTISAMTWARSFAEKLDPAALFTWLEAPLFTQVRVLIAEGSAEAVRKAAEQLEAIRGRSEAWRYANQTIEAAVLQALGLDKMGRAEDALDAVQEAVVLAQPGGWIRPFVEAGTAMREMLERLHRPGDRTADDDIVARIFAAFASHAAPAASSAGRATPVRGMDWSTVDGLTNRELDVLELLAKRHSNGEIASELFVSTHTVNDHLKHIYQKLRVHGRRQAVARASELGILSGS